MILKNHLSYSLLLILVYSVANQRKPFFLLSKGLFQLFCNLLNIFLSGLLVVCKYSNLHLLSRNQFLYGLKKLIRDGTAHIFMLRLAALSNNCINKLNNFLIYFMGFENSLNHYILRHLVGSGLDHNYLLSGRGNSQRHV